MKLSTYIFLIAVCTLSTLYAAPLSFNVQHINTLSSEIALKFALDPDERLYKESVLITVDDPGITLSKPEADHELQQWPGKRMSDARRGWQGPVTLTLTAVQTPESRITNTAHLSVSYATNKQPHPLEQIIPITFQNIPSPEIADAEPAKKVPTTAAAQSSPQPQKEKKSEWQGISSYVKGLVKSTESPWIRLLLVFLLGILMSLTPCIYPMIPITVGILQSQAGDTTGGNALRALAYTFGMGITYALFGLLASCTGPLCGYIFSQPFFVIGLALLLMYFGLCMFGFIDMYIPRFLQVQRGSHGGGSILAAFLFGLASGTLASPCVSPGLALILSIVATLGNKLLGFALLFAFGVGLSMPLLIVGLSAGSLHLLPRAGMWMVEVKKLFGFLLFALSFYYLSAILPLEILLWLIGVFLLTTGIYYIYSSYYVPTTPMWKKFNTFLGMLLIASSVAVCLQAVQTQFFKEIESYKEDIWLSNYQEARERAIKEHKLLFIDVWADFCSICITINKTLLSEPAVTEVLKNEFIPLKVNGTQPSSEPYATIHTQFTITGFPTYLAVNPETNEVIKRWDSKLYKMDIAAFIEKLHKTQK